MTATAIPPVESYVPGIVTRAPEGSLGKIGKTITIVGLVALAASFIALLNDSKTPEGHAAIAHFYQSYLVAYMFTLSLALGALFFVVVQHVTRAGWSVVVRRVAENMTTPLAVMGVLFIPIVIGAPDYLYHHWMHATLDSTKDTYDKVIAGKAGYLNQTFFYIRVVAYFVIWIGLARMFRKKSIEQDTNGNPSISLRLSQVGAPGLALFGVTITFAAFDWMMSINPHWFSTMFGVTYFAGSVMAFLAMLALVCMWLNRRNLLKEAINTEHYHDIGKLMFAFMVFWSYVNFSQYFLIQYADIPEETIWFKERLQGNWPIVGAVLVIGHFLVPFAFLLSRHVKRARVTLAIAAVFLLAMHWLDMVFIIKPTDNHAFYVTWVDFTTLIGLFCIFLGLTIRSIGAHNLLPTRDPRLKESLKFVNI